MKVSCMIDRTDPMDLIDPREWIESCIEDGLFTDEETGQVDVDCIVESWFFDYAPTRGTEEEWIDFEGIVLDVLMGMEVAGC